MLNRAAILVVLSFALALPAAAKGAWVSAEEYPDFQIVLSDDAPEPDYWAAFRFGNHWKRMTGIAIPISREARADKINVWIGQSENPFITEHDIEGLGTDGYVIRTYPRRRVARGSNTLPDGKHLIIVGGEPRGTIYAEWDFFEIVGGVRAFTPAATVWPEMPGSLPRLDIRRVPEIEYRDISYRIYRRGRPFNNASHLNGHWSNVPAVRGGRTAYVRGGLGFGHTFHYFVDPEEYYADHPEYFAEIDGARVKYAQLCLTNESVLAITIQKVRESLRNAAEDERIVSVSQMDYFWFDSWCTCANCRAIDEREGSHSGTIVHFVNRVADAIADEFPGVYIDTFAYLYSRRPPKHIEPRDNVIVRLCDIECDFSRPLSDRRSPRNRAFARDLKKWARITANLHVWDYTQNWYSFQGPHPNIHVLQPNIAFFAKHGVKGVYEQASAASPHSDFEFLKGYILAKSLWDPKVDWEALYREFLEGYYREAAPFVDEYLQSITDRVKRDDVILRFNNDMSWMDYGLVERAQEIFDRAFASVQDETIRERLRYAYIPVQYAALVCPPRVFLTDDAYILTRPPSQTFDEYFAMLLDYRVRLLNDSLIERFRERLNGETPPRYQSVTIEKIRNEYLELWVLPAKGGAIVRLVDRVQGRDLLSGYKNILSVRGRFQEWVGQEIGGDGRTSPVDEAYSVVERGEDSIVLEATLENGLRIRRSVRLVPGLRAMDIELRVTNGGDSGLEPNIELYPEFSIAELGKPRLWVERDGRWERVAFEEATDGIYSAQIPVEGASRWAYRFPEAHVTLANSIDAGALDALGYVYAPEAGFISMGQTLARGILDPGESRSLSTRFEWTATKPKKL